MTRRPPLALEEEEVRRHGGEVLDGGYGVRLGRWTVETCKTPISRDAEMDGYKAKVGGASSLPEQLFGDSYLQLSHADSGYVLRFDAVGALRQSLSDETPPVRVSHSQKWIQEREADVSSVGAQTLDYDWTFTTSYTGEVRAGSGADACSSGKAPGWEATEEGMDRALLTSRDPILFYDDVPLYESELDDNGASQLSVKVRVMPRCWYVLLRFWLRVDGVLVRLRETRVLCAFNEPGLLHREVKHAEATFKQLSGCSSPEAACRDADSTAALLQAMAPTGVQHYQNSRLALPASRVSPRRQLPL